MPPWLPAAIEDITVNSCWETFEHSFLKAKEREGFIISGMKSVDESASIKFKELLEKAKTLKEYPASEEPQKLPPFMYEVPGPELDKVELFLDFQGENTELSLKNGLPIWSSPNKKEVNVMMAFGDISQPTMATCPLAPLNLLENPQGHTREEIKALFPDLNVSLFSIGSGFILRGSGPKERIKDLLMLMRALLVDPDFSRINDELAFLKKDMPSMHLHDDVLLCDFLWRLYLRTSTDKAEMGPACESKTIEELKAAMQAIVFQGIGRIGFCGAEDTAKAAGLLAQIFRNFNWQTTSNPYLKQPLLRAQHFCCCSLLSECTTARILVIFPINDKILRRERSDFEAFAFLFEKAIFKKIRFEQGEGYMPSVLVADTQEVTDDFILVDLACTFENAPLVRDLIEEVACDLVENINELHLMLAPKTSRSRFVGGQEDLLSFIAHKVQSRKEGEVSNVNGNDKENFVEKLRKIFFKGSSSSAIFLPEKSGH